VPFHSGTNTGAATLTHRSRRDCDPHHQRHRKSAVSWWPSHRRETAVWGGNERPCTEPADPWLDDSEQFRPARRTCRRVGARL